MIRAFYISFKYVFLCIVFHIQLQASKIPLHYIPSLTIKLLSVLYTSGVFLETRLSPVLKKKSPLYGSTALPPRGTPLSQHQGCSSLSPRQRLRPGVSCQATPRCLDAQSTLGIARSMFVQGPSLTVALGGREGVPVRVDLVGLDDGRGNWEQEGRVYTQGDSLNTAKLV